MGLIKCPECGKEISNKAPACIHCGYPLQYSAEEKQKSVFYKLTLKSVGVKKVRTIKLVRKVTNCGLRAAKSFIDCPPKLIAGGLLLEDAEKLQKQFSDLGNTVVIEEER